MKKFVTMLVLVAFVGAVAGLVMAEDKPKDETVTLKGTIVKVTDTDKEKSITLKVAAEGRHAKADAEKTREVTIPVNEKTTITLDTKDAKLADLKADMLASVTKPKGKDTVATKIEATTPAPKETK